MQWNPERKAVITHSGWGTSGHIISAPMQPRVPLGAHGPDCEMSLGAEEVTVCTL